MAKSGRVLNVILAFASTVAVVVTVLAPVAPAGAEVANPHGVAVIIGNADYEHRDVPDVTFAHRDADAFRGYVVEVLGFDPKNVIDLRDATRRELFDALGTKRDPRSLLWSYLDTDVGSDVVVFYSGHGVPGVNDKRGYLLPVDADPRAVEDDGYPIDLLYRNVGGLAEASTVRVYLDTCFSGGSHEGSLIRNASPVFVAATLPEGVGGKLTSLTAAMGDQVASWDEEARHGLFTLHVLDALYGGGDADGDGRVTAAEAKRYLDRHMTRAARRQHRRIQEASLVGVADAVLAAAAGGAFPAWPGSEASTEAVALPASGDGRAGKKVVARTEGPSPSAETAESMESGLGLTYEERVLVQHGLASLGEDVGGADGVFGRRTRAGLRSYQKSKGLPETGHLTAELSGALQALGREARRLEEGRRQEELARRAAREAAERESDDASFARAKRLNTVAGYEDYLARGGRHESEARELLAELAPAPAVERARKLSRLLGRDFSHKAVDRTTGWTDLHYAAALDLPQVAKRLLDAGMKADVRLTEGEVPLGKDTIEILGKFDLDKDLIPRTMKTGSRTPLHLAARWNALDVARLLVEHGANVHAKAGPQSHTPLHLAAWRNALDVARLLVERGADVEARTKAGQSTLSWAAMGNALDVARFLVEHGANVEARTKRGASTLHLAARENALDVARFLVEHGVDVEARNKHGISTLSFAAIGNALDVARFLVEHGVDVHAISNEKGLTVLHNAAFHNALDVARFLVERGANVHAKGKHGRTPLHLAAENNALDVARFLVKRGASVNAKNTTGSTPLHYTTWKNALDVARFLVERGANVNPKNYAAQTALHYAVEKNALDVARFLVERGANVNAKDNEGRTPLDLVAGRPEARMDGGQGNELLKLLRSHGGTCARNCG